MVTRRSWPPTGVVGLFAALASFGGTRAQEIPAAPIFSSNPLETHESLLDVDPLDMVFFASSGQSFFPLLDWSSDDVLPDVPAFRDTTNTEATPSSDSSRRLLFVDEASGPFACPTPDTPVCISRKALNNYMDDAFGDAFDYVLEAETAHLSFQSTTPFNTPFYFILDLFGILALPLAYLPFNTLVDEYYEWSDDDYVAYIEWWVQSGEGSFDDYLTHLTEVNKPLPFVQPSMLRRWPYSICITMDVDPSTRVDCIKNYVATLRLRAFADPPANSEAAMDMLTLTMNDCMDAPHDIAVWFVEIENVQPTWIGRLNVFWSGIPNLTIDNWFFLGMFAKPSTAIPVHVTQRAFYFLSPVWLYPSTSDYFLFGIPVIPTIPHEAARLRTLRQMCPLLCPVFEELSQYSERPAFCPPPINSFYLVDRFAQEGAGVSDEEKLLSGHKEDLSAGDVTTSGDGPNQFPADAQQIAVISNQTLQDMIHVQDLQAAALQELSSTQLTLDSTQLDLIDLLQLTIEVNNVDRFRLELEESADRNWASVKRTDTTTIADAPEASSVAAMEKTFAPLADFLPLPPSNEVLVLKFLAIGQEREPEVINQTAADVPDGPLAQPARVLHLVETRGLTSKHLQLRSAGRPWAEIANAMEVTVNATRCQEIVLPYDVSANNAGPGGEFPGAPTPAPTVSPTTAPVQMATNSTNTTSHPPTPALSPPNLLALDDDSLVHMFMNRPELFSCSSWPDHRFDLYTTLYLLEGDFTGDRLAPSADEIQTQASLGVLIRTLPANVFQSPTRGRYATGGLLLDSDNEDATFLLRDPDETMFTVMVGLGLRQSFPFLADEWDLHINIRSEWLRQGPIHEIDLNVTQTPPPSGSVSLYPPTGLLSCGLVTSRFVCILPRTRLAQDSTFTASGPPSNVGTTTQDSTTGYWVASEDPAYLPGGVAASVAGELQVLAPSALLPASTGVLTASTGVLTAQRPWPGDTSWTETFQSMASRSATTQVGVDQWLLPRSVPADSPAFPTPVFAVANDTVLVQRQMFWLLLQTTGALQRWTTATAVASLWGSTSGPTSTPWASDLVHSGNLERTVFPDDVEPGLIEVDVAAQAEAQPGSELLTAEDLGSEFPTVGWSRLWNQHHEVAACGLRTLPSLVTDSVSSASPWVPFGFACLAVNEPDAWDLTKSLAERQPTQMAVTRGTPAIWANYSWADVQSRGTFTCGLTFARDQVLCWDFVPGQWRDVVVEADSLGEQGVTFVGDTPPTPAVQLARRWFPPVATPRNLTNWSISTAAARKAEWHGVAFGTNVTATAPDGFPTRLAGLLALQIHATYVCAVLVPWPNRSVAFASPSGDGRASLTEDDALAFGPGRLTCVGQNVPVTKPDQFHPIADFSELDPTTMARPAPAPTSLVGAVWANVAQRYVDRSGSPVAALFAPRPVRELTSEADALHVLDRATPSELNQQQPARDLAFVYGAPLASLLGRRDLPWPGDLEDMTSCRGDHRSCVLTSIDIIQAVRDAVLVHKENLPPHFRALADINPLIDNLNNTFFSTNTTCRWAMPRSSSDHPLAANLTSEGFTLCQDAGRRASHDIILAANVVTPSVLWRDFTGPLRATTPTDAAPDVEDWRNAWPRSPLNLSHVARSWTVRPIILANSNTLMFSPAQQNIEPVYVSLFASRGRADVDNGDDNGGQPGGRSITIHFQQGDSSWVEQGCFALALANAFNFLNTTEYGTFSTSAEMSAFQPLVDLVATEDVFTLTPSEMCQCGGLLDWTRNYVFTLWNTAVTAQTPELNECAAVIREAGSDPSHRRFTAARQVRTDYLLRTLYKAPVAQQGAIFPGDTWTDVTRDLVANLPTSVIVPAAYKRAAQLMKLVQPARQYGTAFTLRTQVVTLRDVANFTWNATKAATSAAPTVVPGTVTDADTAPADLGDEHPSLHPEFTSKQQQTVATIMWPLLAKINRLESVLPPFALTILRQWMMTLGKLLYNFEPSLNPAKYPKCSLPIDVNPTSSGNSGPGKVCVHLDTQFSRVWYLGTETWVPEGGIGLSSLNDPGGCRLATERFAELLGEYRTSGGFVNATVFPSNTSVPVGTTPTPTVAPTTAVPTPPEVGVSPDAPPVGFQQTKGSPPEVGILVLPAYTKGILEYPAAELSVCGWAARSNRQDIGFVSLLAEELTNGELEHLNLAASAAEELEQELQALTDSLQARLDSLKRFFAEEQAEPNELQRATQKLVISLNETQSSTKAFFQTMSSLQFFVQYQGYFDPVGGAARPGEFDGQCSSLMDCPVQALIHGFFFASGLLFAVHHTYVVFAVGASKSIDGFSSAEDRHLDNEYHAVRVHQTVFIIIAVLYALVFLPIVATSFVTWLTQVLIIAVVVGVVALLLLLLGVFKSGQPVGQYKFGKRE